MATRKKKSDNYQLEIKYEKLLNDLKPEIDFEYKPDDYLKYQLNVAKLQYQRIKCCKINKFKKPFILDNRIQIYHKNELIETSPIFLKKSMRRILNKMRWKQKNAQILYMFDDQWRIYQQNPFKFKRFHYHHLQYQHLDIIQQKKDLENKLKNKLETKKRKKIIIEKRRKKKKKRTNKRGIYLLKSRRLMGSYFVGSTRRSRRIQCV